MSYKDLTHGLVKSAAVAVVLPRFTFSSTSSQRHGEKGGSKVTWGSRSQGGQGMVEYALILVLVSIVVIVILLTMGQQIANVFSNVVAALGA